jgi:diguanylate cyclase (GGDEF)-like protein
MRDFDAAMSGTPSPELPVADVARSSRESRLGNTLQPTLTSWVLAFGGLLAILVIGIWTGQPKALVGLVALALLVLAGHLVVVINRTVNAYEASGRLLQTEKQRLDVAIANMPHGVCMYGADKRLAVANDRYSTMYGLRPEQATPGTTLHEILRARVAAGCSPKNTDEYISQRLQEAFLPEPGYIINELQDGRIIAISRRALPDGGSVAIHQDITQQKRAEEKVLHLAHYDALTELTNRVLFLQEIDKSIAKFRMTGEGFAVHLLDLDRFKDVNDSLGHAVGDFLLCEVASRVQRCAGPCDVVARLGGDEFAVLQRLSGPTPGQITELATDLLAAIARPFHIGSHQLMVETSLGIAIAPDHSLDADELLKKADLALYRAKSEGRNGWWMFETALERNANARLTLAMDLRNANVAEEFELHYQPIITSDGATMVGVEALLRWNNPERGRIGPQDFIALAEETGAIVPLGQWVLQQACRDAAMWPAQIKVAVNLSPVQFRTGNLVECVSAALTNAGLPANRLELEITESVLLKNNADNLQILHQLRKLGIAIVLDDFGTGYSSMSYLLSFPFDKIKIDRKFVAELTQRSDCAAIVNAISGLARSLNIATTAEGVETQEQLVLLRAAGCTFAQGYLFGRPCPKSQLVLARADGEAIRRGNRT